MARRSDKFKAPMPNPYGIARRDPGYLTSIRSGTLRSHLRKGVCTPHRGPVKAGRRAPAGFGLEGPGQSLAA